MTEQFQESALLLVDIQNDFCPGGALAVAEGDRIVPVVNSLIPHFPFVVSSIDWHPPDHVSFKARGGPWPPHCVQGTQGAELHPDLHRERIDAHLRKAFTPDRDAYSEFDAFDDQDRSLDEVLKSRNVKRIYVAGLATDYCVRATVLDGLKRGYEVYAVTDAMRPVEVRRGDGERALEEMEQNGARLVPSEEVLRAAKSGATVR